MEVQKIIESKDNLIQFLKDKGLQEEKKYTDEEYKESRFFKVNKRKLLVVYEIFDEEKLKGIKDHFLIDRGLSYCIIVFNHKIIFFRSFGDTKHFIYSERTKNNPSKIDKLKEVGASIDGLFQTKDISALFYESFKLKRNLLVQNIKNNVKPTEKFLISQKIFDRFFFIYFLCHKGIIKFKDGRKISGENLFSRILLKKGLFLENLKQLFKLFNSQEKDILKIGDYEIVIPYLNGGLFRPDVLEQDLDIKLKSNQWEEIFDFLNSYHWIIEEVKVTEENEDKILTPEILGHVYERSVVEWEQKGFEEEAKEAVKKVTERKKKGVYYTPESITDYISNNTIIPYLLNKLGNKYDSFDALIESNCKRDFKDAIKILNEIKVLDPACGSGAFLIKASEVIFALKRRIEYLTGEKKNFYDLKLEIITENIYGVDILSGAIEISKLRLWLWLISDYEESKNSIKALPNIEYNLKVGNSLVGWLDEKLVQMPMNTPLTEKVDGIFTGLIAFSENDDGEELKKARELLRGYKLNEYIEAYYILYKIYRKTHGLKAQNLRSILETIRSPIYSTVTPAFLDYLNNKIKPKYDKKNPPLSKEEFDELNVFHWSIDFGHIILNGGFDVVLANPPYVDSENMVKNMELERYIYPYLYQTTKGNWDLYIPFYERAFNVVEKLGYICFITPNKWLSIGYGKALRSYLQGNLTRLCSCDEIKVFKDAGNSPVITFFTKTKSKNKILIDFYKPDYTVTQNKSANRKIIETDNWGMLISKFLNLLLTIYENSHLLNSICQVENPFSVSEAYDLKEYLYDGKNKSNKDLKLVNTGTIDKFTVLWGIKETSYIKEKFKHPYLKKTSFKQKMPRRFEQSNSQKIIIAGMRYFECFLDSEGEYVAGKSTLIIRKVNSISLESLNAFLNSKLVEFYLKETYGTSGIDGGVNFTTSMIESFPIPILKPHKEKLEKINAKICSFVKDNKNTINKTNRDNFIEMLNELDSIIYKIYGLNKEEITLIKQYPTKKI